MIRIDRGRALPQLEETRHRQLARAFLVLLRGGSPGDIDFGGYDRKVERGGREIDSVQRRLFNAQSRKCAYCERIIGREGQPIEHFRPKAGALRVPHDQASRDPDRYWWLAWTWENLFLACSTCNSQSLKGNNFPITGVPLPVPRPAFPDAHRFDPASEAGLIDPAVEDPIDLIEWHPTSVAGDRAHWSWLPRRRPGLDRVQQARAKGTLDTFRWMGNSLSIDVTDYIRRSVWRRYREISHIPEARHATAWQDLLSDLFGAAPFQAAAWCAISLWQKLDGPPMSTLPLPRPGPPLRLRQPSPGLPLPPVGVPDLAWIRLLAGEELEEAVRASCQGVPRTTAQLEGLLCEPPSRLSLSDLRDTLAQLEAKGCLTRQPDGTWR